MASSRWKRFAFFDRHTLSLPSEVLEDLIPVGHDPATRRSLRSLNIADGEAAGNDSVSLVVTTAGLPLTSKPKKDAPQSNDLEALGAMWSSVTACASPQLPDQQPLVQLPSQGLQGQSVSDRPSQAGTSVDGLVLVFVTSRDTELVHCFDVTLRCNRDAEEMDLEDLDGWRGYFAPFSNQKRATGQEGVVAEHMNDPSERLVGLAACRVSTGQIHVACMSHSRLVVWEDPHLDLSCRRPLTVPKSTNEMKVFTLQSWNSNDGKCLVVDIVPGIVAVGTDTGAVLVFLYRDSQTTLRSYLRVPPPPMEGVEVVSVNLALGSERASIFVAYRIRATASAQMSSSAGVCCYEMPLPSGASTLSAPSARHDLDGRYVGSSSLVDASARFDAFGENNMELTVARPDGLYSYSKTERTGVTPIDGTKLAICLIPPPSPPVKMRPVSPQVACGYSLVASTDAKSGRDAVDIYDSTNKLVAFHLLLSPGHKAVRAAGVATSPDSNGVSRSSGVVLTSGGSLVTLTEKRTEEKISLLVQKNLYSAAIVVAYADSNYDAGKSQYFYLILAPVNISPTSVLWMQPILRVCIGNMQNTSIERVILVEQSTSIVTQSALWKART
jgi:hypothetical protein